MFEFSLDIGQRFLRCVRGEYASEECSDRQDLREGVDERYFLLATEGVEVFQVRAIGNKVVFG